VPRRGILGSSIVLAAFATIGTGALVGSVGKGGSSMAVRIEVSQEIDRPVGVVFNFYADDHVRNHPRWNPDIELWRTSDEPLGLGTIIQRRNSHGDTPVEGTMEVVEYEPNQAFGVVVREGSMEIPGRATFEEVREGRTRLTVAAEMPIDESMKDRMTALLQRSLQNIKELIEAET
jgi:Polyketide cyclase / dehydrase and lipid transport